MNRILIDELDTAALRKRIMELISLGTEGDFWDFKKSWHSNKADLLHDIICMANNLTNHDGLIIIGVENATWKLPGNLSIDTNRKTQQNVIDFLKNKHFAGGVRPTVYVRTISIFEGANKDVGVIIVKNTDKTPYFLSDNFQESHKELYKGNIYTRVGDTNTPKTETADIDKVEMLWRRRFGIDKTAIEKLKLLLSKTEDWHPLGTDGVHSSRNSYGKWFNRYYPEFTICYKRNESWPMESGCGIRLNDQEYYWLTELDKVPDFHDFSIFDIDVMMHTTSLFSGKMIMDINGKYSRMWWKISYLLSGSNLNLFYAYVEKDSIEFLLDNFLANCQETIPRIEQHKFISSVDQFKKYYCTDRPYNIIPVFQNNFERKSFEEYIKSRHNDFSREIGNWTKSEEKTGEAFDVNRIKWLCDVGRILVSWLTAWRNENANT